MKACVSQYLLLAIGVDNLMERVVQKMHASSLLPDFSIPIISVLQTGKLLPPFGSHW
jgi:hypothetical protein